MKCSTLFTRLVSIVMVLCLLSFVLVPIQAKADKISCVEYSGSNQLSEYHQRWGSPVGSHLVEVESGLMRFQEISSNDDYLVEYFDDQYQFLRSVIIPRELSVYGGFYASGSHYYILSGQNNPSESAEVECFRITKYDLKWNRLGSAGLYDCNTTVPFDAGSARFAMSGKYLLIRTAHEMYTSDDGKNHQANMTIRVDTDTMTILDSSHKVAFTGYGYVSHSFNQFIKMDGDTLLAVDHGDAYPRSIVLTQCDTNMFADNFIHSYAQFTQTNLLSFPGRNGDNTTNASVGGFEISGSSYLVAYNYVVNYVEGLSYSQEIRATRNVFVAAVDKETGEVTQKQITNYADGEATASVPHLVKISDSSFLLLWERGNDVYYTLLNANGDPVGQIHSFPVTALSDCVPLVHNGRVIWYVWKDNNVEFYEINLEDMHCNPAAQMTYGHSFMINSYPDTVGGNCSRKCLDCGYEENGSTPSDLTLWWRIGGTGYYWSSPQPSEFDVGEQLELLIRISGEDFTDYTLSISDPSGVTVRWDDNQWAEDDICYLTFTAVGTYTITVTCDYNPLLSRSQTVTISHYDANGDSICDGCGSRITDITQKGRTLNYEDLIYVIDIFDLVGAENVDLNKDAGLLVWSVDEFEALDEIAFDAEHANPGLKPYRNTGYYYGSSEGIFTRDLYKEAYYVGYLKLADGSYVYSEPKLYSPAIYAYSMLSKTSTSAETKELCVALLNYISAAQMYFDKTTPVENLVNADLSDEQKALNWENISFNLAPEVPADKQVERDTNVFTGTGKNLLFEEMISIVSIFKIDDSIIADAKEYGTIYWTAEQFAALEGAPSIDNIGAGTKTGMSVYRGNVGQWYSQAPEIAAKNMADTQYFYLGYVIHADGTVSYSGVQSYTVEQYISNTVGKTSTSDEMRAFAQWLYFYERAAKDAIA